MNVMGSFLVPTSTEGAPAALAGSKGVGPGVAEPFDVRIGRIGRGSGDR